MLGAFSNAEPHLVSCNAEPDVSFSYTFDLIHPYAGNSTGCSRSPLYRICSLMRKMKAQCYVREELLHNDEISDEIASASLRTSGKVTGKATRFSFFREWPQSGDWRGLSKDSCLGYFVDLELTLPGDETRRHVLESVVRPPSLWLNESECNGGHYEPLPNSYVHCCRHFRTPVGPPQDNTEFPIQGAFFCQQNDLTHVCAHAALRMAVNSSPINPRPLSEIAGNQVKLTNKHINDALGIDWKSTAGRKIGHYGKDGQQGGGLTIEQIKRVVTGLGWQVHSADFADQPSIDYQSYIYPLVESGCPTILAIMRPEMAHVVAVHGHTRNSDRWTPEARTRRAYGGLPLSSYIPTSAWADHFVMSDDNFGMYVTLPTEEIRNLLVPKYNANLHAAHAIGLVPQGVTTPGYYVEQKSACFAARFVEATELANGVRWFAELSRNHESLVCRTFLADKLEYIREMEHLAIGANNLAMLHAIIPDTFWLTEISTPDLYQTNKTKLGDVIACADELSANPKDILGGLVFAWFPAIAVQVQEWVMHQDWPIDKHIPLLRRDAKSLRVFEW
jgi:hypothetical protein